MGLAFADISFTPAVKAAQERHGSRAQYQRAETSPLRRDELGEMEIDFISQRDSFYMASVNADGWPYVQHRGGPAGFLQVLDARTIAFADFMGNRQYLSVGNLETNDRVSLILVDYAGRQRLKIWGHARVREAADDPALAARLAQSGYQARVEHLFVIDVKAFDWNCPQHITRRFTENQVDALLRSSRQSGRTGDQSARPFLTGD